MQAFFSDPYITLYQGDALTCLSGLESNGVDAVVTDPPYSSGAFTLPGKQASPRIKYQNTSTVKMYPEMMAAISAVSSAGRLSGLPSAGVSLDHAPLFWCFQTGGSSRP